VFYHDYGAVFEGQVRATAALALELQPGVEAAREIVNNSVKPWGLEPWDIAPFSCWHIVYGRHMVLSSCDLGCFRALCTAPTALWSRLELIWCAGPGAPWCKPRWPTSFVEPWNSMFARDALYTWWLVPCGGGAMALRSAHDPRTCQPSPVLARRFDRTQRRRRSLHARVRRRCQVGPKKKCGSFGPRRWRQTFTISATDLACCAQQHQAI
jgi:hypothetical protein